MFSEKEEDNVLAPKEPQITSEIPEERKAARALRIKRRDEALRRAEQPLEEISLEEEPNLIEKTTAAAAEKLQHLSLDGAAKVTNVKVTTDEREVIRRALFSDKMNDSKAKIEAEANEAQIQYDVITANWDTMLALKDPLEIDAEMKEQQRKCQELLAQKDNLIDELKNDLKKKDEAYFADLEKQDKDLKELSERVEKQVTIMQRAYEQQLYLIEQAICFEREAMIEYNGKRWDALYKQRDKEEIAHMEERLEKLEEHKEEMEIIMWDHHAKYREAKIELESLIQELQKELEKLKSTCIINAEKIGYSYQVLRKREEENIFVRSEQKRKLNKMNDVANKLRTNIRKAAEAGALEEIRADAEIVKLMEAMDDLEKKSRHFSHVNNYKFCQVWRMSSSRCSELARDVRHAEVALHAHVLAQPPPPPPPSIPKSPLVKYELELSNNTDLVCANDQARNRHDNKYPQADKDKLVSHILQLVADNTGFLVEDRLLQLIKKYQITSRNLCTLDSIFMALEIQADEDIELLCKTLLNYSFCPICLDIEVPSEFLDQSTLGASGEISRASVTNKGMRGDTPSVRTRLSVARSLSTTASRSTHTTLKPTDLSPDDQLLIAEADEIMQKCGDPKAATTTEIPSEGELGASRRMATTGRVTVVPEPVLARFDGSKRSNPFRCSQGHNLEIEPIQVLSALNEFMTAFMPPEKKKLYDILENVKPPNFISPSRKLSISEIEQYWILWKDLFPPEKDRFWDGLIIGLNNYLTILQERERLHDEVVQLRQRNAALRQLVRGELPEIPTERARYREKFPPAFTAPVPDTAPLGLTSLPPI